MSVLRSFGRFWWDFVVGDDWRVAVAIAAGLGITAVLTHWGSRRLVARAGLRGARARRFAVAGDAADRTLAAAA